MSSQTIPLSAKQVRAYLDRIQLPPRIEELLQQGPDGLNALEAVTKLQTYHLKAIPFENLDIAYSTSKSLPQDTASVFQRAVTDRRGGVCDQIHPLFAKLLQYFGFNVYCTGSRINAAAGILSVAVQDESQRLKAQSQPPSFGSWIHLNTIVTIHEQEYVVDTSHGPSGFPTPVPLIHDQPEHDIFPRQRRMINSTLPGWSSRQKWWRMQTRWSDTEPWLDVWAFTETEWLQEDFEVLRQGYGAMRTGWTNPTVCCFQTEYEEDVPTGYRLILGDEVRRSYKGTVEVLRKLYSEEDRALALEEEFGIVLSDEEKDNIKGHMREIQGGEYDFY